jgi:hypothetical protein
MANATLGGAKVTDVHIDPRTGDIQVSFGQELTLGVWTSSSGYENWTATFRTGGDEVTLIGAGGGELYFVRYPVGSKPKRSVMRRLN